MSNLIIIGAGGHSKSVFDSLDRGHYKVCGFIDENKKGTHLGFPILGSNIYDIKVYQDFVYFVAIGDNNSRRMWFNRIVSMGLQTINIIDPTALVSSTAKMGTGNFIGKYAIINADTIIGDNNVINTKALVEHECIVGNHNHLSTNSTINGNVVIEDKIFLGSSAVCNGQLRIGHDAIIGSGAVIIKDVEPFTTVVGVPGRIVKRRDSITDQII